MLKKYLIYFNNIFKILFQHVNQYEELLMSNCIYFCVPSLCNLVYFIFTVYFDLDQSHLNAQKSHVTPCLPYWTILSSAINHLRLLTHCIRFSEIVLNIYHHFSNKTGNYWTMMTNDLDFNLDFFFSFFLSSGRVIVKGEGRKEEQHDISSAGAFLHPTSS